MVFPTLHLKSILPSRSQRSSTHPILLLPDVQGTTWTVLDAEWADHSLQVHKLLTYEAPQEIVDLDAETVGYWLGQQLEESGCQRSHAVLVLDHQSVLLKSTRFPTAAIDEIPDLAQCYLESQWTNSNSPPITDCAAISIDQETQSTHVLIAGVTEARLRRLRQIGETAGFRISQVVPAGLQLARLAPRLSDVFILWGHEGVCIVFRTSDGVRSMQNIKLPTATPRQQVRFLAACLQDMANETNLVLSEQSIQLLSIGPSENVADEIRQQTGWPIEEIDLSRTLGLSLPEFVDIRNDQMRVLLALAELLPQVTQDREVNFLQPFRPRQPSSWRNKSLVRVACFIGVCLAAGGAWLWQEHQCLDQQILALQEEQARLAKQIEHAAPLVAQGESLENWQKHRVEWGSELQQFHRHIPAESSVVLTGFQGSSQQQTGKNLIFEGVAGNQQEVLELQRSLVESDGEYQYQPHEISAASKSPRYPVQFRIDAEQRKPIAE